MKGAIKKISINGFKSIRELHELELRDLNLYGSYSPSLAA
jgi:hypothetical protein